MYPYLHSQNQYIFPTNNNPNYHHETSDDRKRHTSNEQLLVGVDKFVRRYESELHSRENTLRQYTNIIVCV